MITANYRKGRSDAAFLLAQNGQSVRMNLLKHTNKGNEMMTEKEANDAIRSALVAIRNAQEACERVAYGSLVLGPLADAYRETAYALDVAEGRK